MSFKNFLGVVFALLAVQPGLVEAAGVQSGRTVSVIVSMLTGEVSRLAQAGNGIAQNNLGVRYATGRGIAKDEKQAVAWYRKAATQGYAIAQNNLGAMYQNAEGVDRDYKQAVAWYRKAAAQGNANAQHNLASMYDNDSGGGYSSGVGYRGGGEHRGNMEDTTVVEPKNETLSLPLEPPIMGRSQIWSILRTRTANGFRHAGSTRQYASIIR